MKEQHIKLLKMALSIGWDVIYKIRETLEFCDDGRNDYYNMLQVVGEKLGIDLNDSYD